MWVPHFGYIFWPREGQNTKVSEIDKSEREFEVVFHLEDPDKRSVQDSRLRLETPIQQLQTELIKEQKIESPMLLENNDKGHLSRVRFKVEANSKHEATSYAYNSLSQILSVTTFSTSIPIAIWAIIVLDKKHNVSWEAKPQVSKDEPFQMPEGIYLDNKFKAIFSLYREGRNSQSPFYRFFCFSKILEGFYEKRLPFAEADKILKSQKGQKRVKRRVDKQLLVYSLAYPKYQDLIGKTYGLFWDWINSKHRHLIAHTFPHKHPESEWLNLDNYELFTEFAIIGNITELVIRNIMIDELELWNKFLEEGIVKI